MKNDTLLIIGAAAVGLFFISRVAKGMGGGASPSSTGAARAVAVPSQSLWTTPTDTTLTLGQQYAEYGYGAGVAEVYNNSGYLGTTK